MLFNAVVGALIGVSFAFSSRVPSDETLRRAFDHGQRFYVREDYEQAISEFEIIRDIEKSRFVDESRVLISVGGVDFPVKVAATYQLGNAYRNLSQLELERARRTADEEVAERHRQNADTFLQYAAEYYHEAGRSTTLEEIVMLSRYQLVRTHFQAANYEGVIVAGEELISQFPTSDYVDETLYEMGWAHYQLGNFVEAIEIFRRLIDRGSSDYRVDRARFQMGRSYYETGEYQRTRDVLQTLIERYDFVNVSESERLRMEVELLMGVVRETAVELIAKSHMLIGDTYVAEGRVDEGVAAYRTVIVNYGQERGLVEKAYEKIAKAHLSRNEVERAVQVYRRAIDEVSDQAFRARMQTRVARTYYEYGEYDKAASAYDIYIRAYGDIAARGALEIDRAYVQKAHSYFEQAEGARAAGDQDAAGRLYTQAAARYAEVLDRFPASSLRGESLFSAGLSLQRRGDADALDKALVYFQNVRAEFEHRLELASRALLQMARLYHTRGDYDEAVKAFEEYLDDDVETDQHPRALLELGVCLRDAGRADAALAALERIPAGHPLWAQAGVLGGELLLRDGRLERARELLEQGLASANDEQQQAELHYLLGRVKFEQRAYQAAVVSFDRALADSEKSDIVTGSLFGRGCAYYHMGHTEEAVRDLEHLLSVDPPASMRDQAHRLLARCYVRMGRRAEAIRDYRAIIEGSSVPEERAEYTLLLAELYHSLGRFEDARAQAQAVLQKDIADQVEERGYFLKERAYFLTGDAWAQQERHQDAYDWFAAGLAEYPSSGMRSDLVFGQAVAAFSLESFDEASAEFEAFIEEFPDNPNQETAHYLLAYAWLRLTRFDEAATWFGKLVDRFPTSDVADEALFQRAESLFNLTRFGDAAENYRRIVREYPASEFVDNAIYNLGWCYFELGNTDAAISQFERLLSDYPMSEFAASAQFTLGDHHFNQGNYDKAAEAYRVVVTNYSHAPSASEAKQLLSEIVEIQAYLSYEEAMSLFDAEEYEAAAKALRQVVEQYPDTDTRAGAMANLGMAYEFLNRWHEAAQVYRDLTERYQGDPHNAAAVAFAEEHLNWIKSNRL